MNKIKLIFIICLAFLSQKTFAAGPLHLDLHASAGYGKAEVESASESPSMVQYGVGTTLGWKFFPLLYAGVSADYYLVTQLTKPNSSFGNRKGKRMNLASPTVGIDTGKLHLKFDYQLLGTYDLDKTTSSGQKVGYAKPTGMRVYLGYRYAPTLELGAFYETVSYKEEKVGDATSELTNKLKISQIGLAWTWSI